MLFPRATGILLHPTSLPSGGGIGDLGPAAYEFVDFLAAARQGLWQVLPLGPPANGNSPYSSTSAFAGNPLLISLERLAERGWTKPEPSTLSSLAEKTGAVDYEDVYQSKLPLIVEAARTFFQEAQPTARNRFERFCRANAWWLEDFVLFDALRERYARRCWKQWPRELASRQTAALDDARTELASEINLRRVMQFFFYEQWRALRLYCAQRSIRVVGDIAIFVDHDSADVWSHRNLFRLREDDFEPEAVSGVPPDAFSATGQRWGEATIGGLIVCAGPRRLATTFASITSAGSSSSGRFPPASQPR